MSSAACFWIASTTFGWQCPVEQTAMPAAKSRNEFPSTSSTIAPWPFLATNAYSRVSDGDMYFASAAITCCAFGPGSAVTRRGVFSSKVVGISSSKKKISGWSESKLQGAEAGAKKFQFGSFPEPACKQIKLSQRRKGLAAGRPAGRNPGG